MSFHVVRMCEGYTFKPKNLFAEGAKRYKKIVIRILRHEPFLFPFVASLDYSLKGSIHFRGLLLDHFRLLHEALLLFFQSQMLGCFFLHNRHELVVHGVLYQLGLLTVY